jgi:hypothetical protein
MKFLSLFPLFSPPLTSLSPPFIPPSLFSPLLNHVSTPCPTPLLFPYLSSDVLRSVSSHFFVLDSEIFLQLEGLKLEADDELIYVFDIDAVPIPDNSKHPMVSIFITDAFIGEEVNKETPSGLHTNGRKETQSGI